MWFDHQLFPAFSDICLSQLRAVLICCCCCFWAVTGRLLAYALSLCCVGLHRPVLAAPSAMTSLFPPRQALMVLFSPVRSVWHSHIKTNTKKIYLMMRGLFEAFFWFAHLARVSHRKRCLLPGPFHLLSLQGRLK